MDSIALGKKIKEARIAKKMTQNEVVGNFITRNMLSQIESGTANPSIKTLKYLSNVLNIPLNQLISDSGQESTSEPLQKLLCVKKLFQEQKYEKLIECAKDYPSELSDEFSALLTRSYLELAKKAEQNDNNQKASKYVSLALEYADRGLYANSVIKSEAVLLLNDIAQKLSKV